MDISITLSCNVLTKAAVTSTIAIMMGENLSVQAWVLQLETPASKGCASRSETFQNHRQGVTYSEWSLTGLSTRKDRKHGITQGGPMPFDYKRAQLWKPKEREKRYSGADQIEIHWWWGDGVAASKCYSAVDLSLQVGSTNAYPAALCLQQRWNCPLQRHPLETWDITQLETINSD